MKIALIILILTAIATFGGMFYWMWKARHGELNLSSKAWHVKLLNYMWEFEINGRENACPYYWGLVVSVLFLPIYLVVRYLLYTPHSWLKDKLNNIPRIKTPKFIEKIHIPTVNIPETKKEWFKLVYTRGKDIFQWFLIIGGATILFCLVLVVFIYPWLKFNGWVLITIELIILFLLTTTIVSLLKPEWNKYHIEHYENLFKSIFGIIAIPFVIIGAILKFLFSGIHNIYSRNCPPIVFN